MRKQLLATTALAVAGGLALAAGPAAADAMAPKLTVGGFMQQNVGVGQDANGDSRTIHEQDGEIIFTVSGKLDNGITVSGRSELEADTDNGGPDIDESFITVGGSFGSVRLGGTDSAAYEMSYTYMGSVATNAGVYTLEFDVGTFIPAPTGTIAAASGRAVLPNDDGTLFYMTPRFNGMQLGVSYAQSGGGVEDVVSIGANYNGSFGDTGVGVALGYVEGSSDTADKSAMGAGIKVTVGGVTTAAGFVSRDNGDNNDISRMDIGVRYKFGPNSLAFGYLNVEDEMSRATNAAKFTIARTLGPGVTWSLDVLWAEYDDGSNTTDGTGLSTGVALSF